MDTAEVRRRFLEHFAQISDALRTQGLWDETDGFFYDRITMDDGAVVPVKVRSMVGVLPVLATVVIDEELIGRAETFGKAFNQMLGHSGVATGTLSPLATKSWMSNWISGRT